MHAHANTVGTVPRHTESAINQVTHSQNWAVTLRYDHWLRLACEIRR